MDGIIGPDARGTYRLAEDVWVAARDFEGSPVNPMTAVLAGADAIQDLLEQLGVNGLERPESVEGHVPATSSDSIAEALAGAVLNGAAKTGVGRFSEREIISAMVIVANLRAEASLWKENFDDVFNHAVELFNPPDGHPDLREMMDAAAEFIVGQPCQCTPVGIDACRRCQVLGLLGDEPIAR